MITDFRNKLGANVYLVNLLRIKPQKQRVYRMIISRLIMDDMQRSDVMIFDVFLTEMTFFLSEFSL